jgi:AcrR family transcriptional regulator
MTAPTGRREASKQATRAALQAAALQLFAERGYDATTVADIARAANVTHRTFYRYFDGKDGLLADQYLTWLAALRSEIMARPAGEAPVMMVWQAMVSAAKRTGSDTGPAPLTVLSQVTGERQRAGLRQSGIRPLLRLEREVSEALTARFRAGQAEGAGDLDAADEFRAQVIARVTVATFRSALIRYRELLARGESAPGILKGLLDQAFSIVVNP